MKEGDSSVACTTCANHDPKGSLETAPAECYACSALNSHWIPKPTLRVPIGFAKNPVPPATPMPARPAYYTALAIPPFEYAMRNKLDAMQFSVVKYVTRFRDKGGLKDLRKAQDCLEQLIKYEEANANQAK